MQWMWIIGEGIGFSIDYPQMKNNIM